MLASRIIRPSALRIATRSFSASVLRAEDVKKASTPAKVSMSIADVDGPESLFGPGGKDGHIATDFEQATGLERLELLGKLEGIDLFDQRPLDASRKGTMTDPIVVDSFDPVRYVGCTGSPAGSHETVWTALERERVARCWECGSVYKMRFIGLEDDGHGHH
ncbi:hypothetical protein CANCADRAFT_32380 [Tortispora caseinolytica NRRL Y-17796]|uniref:Cytochrome c oxidase subunit 4, mitochondrial n=1 Tax=Tortispora caseinolytica NRRL Y-17796 TaxID=767744 RepID=A0A1E4TB49_9ASCO|nr:hypothetical protein CANCADRAFT_32380 [Tortispora caseinolytica NRRL Y-17796]